MHDSQLTVHSLINGLINSVHLIESRSKGAKKGIRDHLILGVH